jgi:hypothetical protein
MTVDWAAALDQERNWNLVQRDEPSAGTKTAGCFDGNSLPHWVLINSQSNGARGHGPNVHLPLVQAPQTGV